MRFVFFCVCMALRARWARGGALRYGGSLGAAQVAGVVGQYLLTQGALVEVCVQLGGGDVLVAEHGLDGVEAGAALEQVSGEGVAEGVGADGFRDARGLRLELDEVEHGDAREVAAARVGQEYVVLLALARLDLLAVDEPQLQLAHGARREGHEALFAALALDAEVAFGEVEVGDLEVAGFADAQAAAVEDFDDGAVAEAFALGHVDRGDDAVDLLDGEDGGEPVAYLGGLVQAGGVLFEVFVEHEEMVEGAYAGEDARHGAHGDADVLEGPGEAVEVVEGHGERLDALFAQEGEQLLEVVPVGLARVGRKAHFEHQVGPVA